jgi:hypothetical protein
MLVIVAKVMFKLTSKIPDFQWELIEKSKAKFWWNKELEETGRRGTYMGPAVTMQSLDNIKTV